MARKKKAAHRRKHASKRKTVRVGTVRKGWKKTARGWTKVKAHKKAKKHGHKKAHKAVRRRKVSRKTKLKKVRRIIHHSPYMFV